MPIYSYVCPAGHQRDHLRKYEQRDDSVTCEECGESMRRTMSVANIPPDGVYSYEPNIGSKEKFERQHEQLRSEDKIPKRYR